MNLTSLDDNLRMYTKSELRYKAGFQSNFWEKLPVSYYNDKPVYLFNSTGSLSDSIHKLSVKKQSRFSPCPLHTHTWVEINYMYSGSCPQTINDQNYILKEGQVILIDTDTPHSTQALGDNDIMISILIDKDYLNTNFFNRMSKDSILSQFFINAIAHNTNHNNYILFHSNHSRRIPIFFKELLCEFFDPSLNSNDMINSLFNLILSELINVYENDMEKQNIKLSNKISIIAILRYLEGNFKTCTLDSTATFFNMNPNYLTTLLKQHTGMSYKELVQYQRLKYAEKLLANTQLPITEIANSIGYENISFFYRKFKQAYGCLPKEYRKKHTSRFS